MRTILFLVVVLAFVSPAVASPRVVVMSDREPMTAALRVDVGVRGGVGHGTAYGAGDTGEVQLTYAWESSVELTLAPLLAGFRGHDYIPGAMASLRARP